MLETKKLFKRLGVLLAVLVLLAALALPAFADTGPKPSVEVRFQGLPDTVCYATLLSQQSSTGPAYAWDGDPETAYYDGSPDHAVWQAFVQYEDADGFFFLQQSWQVDGDTPLRWGYYPPQCFKVLLYFPETNAFVCSETLERYAFDSYFTAVLQSGDAPTLTVTRDSDARNLGGLWARIAITLAVELLLALLFGLRGSQLGLVAAANVLTQILLNAAVQLLRIPTDPTRYVIGYLLLELLVFAIEAGVYCLCLPKMGGKKRRIVYVLYALVANAASFGAGLLLAQWVPQIF